jgi:hypothetical protein
MWFPQYAEYTPMGSETDSAASSAATSHDR